MGQKNRRLSLARDRIGEKHRFYYGWINKAFVFASELKSFNALLGFKKNVDRSSLALFLRFNSIPAPFFYIQRNIYKVEPGSILTLTSGSSDVSKVYYWSTDRILQAKGKERFSGTPKQSVDHLENLLLKAIDGQMQADVSVGAFLSGGVDSSTVVALMQSLSTTQVDTFSIGFNSRSIMKPSMLKPLQIIWN